ncbi:hypothetical protein [Streptomyces sp. NPDC095613]|uniref:hypothetical protein n=1 Tax=Streptomyces sp. NPDC095613 TaxID=3155540 RepID=UPI0033276FEA
MRRVAPVVPRPDVVRAAAERRTLIVALVLAAFLAMTLASLLSSVASAQEAEPPPPVSAPRDPAGEGQQQDPAETEQTAPARTERSCVTRVRLVCRHRPYGPDRAPRAGRCAPSGAPAVPGPTRCVVLRC